MFTEDKASGETPNLDGFIKFCETKQPDEKYHWTNSQECACGQYLKSIGQFTQNWVGSTETMGKLNRIAGGGGLETSDFFISGYPESEWTFGQCLDRAKKARELA